MPAGTTDQMHGRVWTLGPELCGLHCYLQAHCFLLHYTLQQTAFACCWKKNGCKYTQIPTSIAGAAGVLGVGPSQQQKHLLEGLSEEDECLPPPAKKRIITEEGSGTKQFRLQDYYVKQKRSEVNCPLAPHALVRSCSLWSLPALGNAC